MIILVFFGKFIDRYGISGERQVGKKVKWRLQKPPLATLFGRPGSLCKFSGEILN